MKADWGPFGRNFYSTDKQGGIFGGLPLCEKTPSLKSFKTLVSFGSPPQGPKTDGNGGPAVGSSWI